MVDFLEDKVLQLSWFVCDDVVFFFFERNNLGNVVFCHWTSFHWSVVRCDFDLVQANLLGVSHVTRKLECFALFP
jgi:hypothetical protein